MLVALDVESINKKVVERMKGIAKKYPDDFADDTTFEMFGIHCSPQDGFYYGDFNLRHLFDDEEAKYCEYILTNDREVTFEGKDEDFKISDENWRCKYGVADNIEQILAKYPELVTSDRLYFVNLTVVTKTNCPDWRWHKWGEYIGTQKPTMEHIGDEPNIKEVTVFHIHELSQRT